MYKLAPTIRLVQPAPRSILTPSRTRALHLMACRLRQGISSHLLDSMHRILDGALQADELQGLDSHTLRDIGLRRD